MDFEAHSKSTHGRTPYPVRNPRLYPYGTHGRTPYGAGPQPCVPSSPRSSSGSNLSQDFFAVFVSESFTHV